MSRLDPALRRAGLVAGATLALDQLTKVIARSELAPGERVELVAGVELRRIGNEGIAFGLLEGLATWVLLLAGVGFLVLLAYFLASEERDRLWLPIGLLGGGALGNLLDRIARGAVTDFIDPPNWPTFNLADVAITAGIVLLVVILWRTPEGAETAAEVRDGAR